MILWFIMFVMLMTSCSNRLVSVLMDFEANSVHKFQQNANRVHNKHKLHERNFFGRLICADDMLGVQKHDTPELGLTDLGNFQALAVIPNAST